MKKILLSLMLLSMILLSGCTDLLGEEGVVCVRTGELGYVDGNIMPSEFEVARGNCDFGEEKVIVQEEYAVADLFTEEQNETTIIIPPVIPEGYSEMVIDNETNRS